MGESWLVDALEIVCDEAAADVTIGVFKASAVIRQVIRMMANRGRE
jgi:hypothetical protein